MLPMRLMTPALASMASLSIVFPEEAWPTTAKFRISESWYSCIKDSLTALRCRKGNAHSEAECKERAQFDAREYEQGSLHKFIGIVRFGAAYSVLCHFYSVGHAVFRQRDAARTRR